MKNNWIYGLIISVLGLAGFFWWKHSRKGSSGSGTGTGINLNPFKSSFPLRYGSKNNYVKQLQSVLGVKVDGKFGDETSAACIEAFGTATISKAKFNEIIAGESGTEPEPTVNNTDASDLVTQIHYQIKEKWGLVNPEPFNQLDALPEAGLRGVADKYAQLYEISLADEIYHNLWYPPASAKSVLEKLTSYGYQSFNNLYKR